MAVARLPRHGAELITSFSLPKFYENFDDQASISNPALSQSLAAEMQKITAAALI